MSMTSIMPDRFTKVTTVSNTTATDSHVHPNQHEYGYSTRYAATQTFDSNLVSHSQQINPERYWSLLLLILSFAGITGNTLVIIAVVQVRKLKSNTNLVLSSLASADLLVSILVMPPGMLQLISGCWILGDISCSLYIFLDVCLCTSSILHMCCVSIDRYLGIAFPLKLTQMRTRRATWWKIFGVWLLSILIACPIFIHAAVARESIFNQGYCGVNSDAFMLYGSMCAFIIPLVVMTVTYYLTIRILNNETRISNHKPKLRRERGVYIKPEKLHQQYSHSGTAPSLTHRTSLTTESGADTISMTPRRASVARMYYEPIDTVSCQWDRQMNDMKREAAKALQARKQYVGHKLGCSNCPLNNELKHDTIPENGVCKNDDYSDYRTLSRFSKNATKISGSMRSNSYSSGENESKSVKSRSQSLTKQRSSLVKMVSQWKHKSTKNGKVDLERKATQVLGIVFLAFVLSWTPFFIVNLITALCRSCHITELGNNFVLWVGYSASIINPIIYTIINKHFQKAFRDILTCRLWCKRRTTLQKCIQSVNKKLLVMPVAMAGPRTILPQNSPVRDLSDETDSF